MGMFQKCITYLYIISFVISWTTGIAQVSDTININEKTQRPPVDTISNKATSTITGYVRDSKTQEPLFGAAVRIEGSTIGNVTDERGYFKVERVPVGSYNLIGSLIGYEAQKKNNVVLTSGNTLNINFELSGETRQLAEVQVTASAFRKPVETPNSIQTLTRQEIQSYPGANNDIARVVQSLPGVSGSVGFRNDIIIRGGAPNENVYYLDGVEIPNINHFATQGSAGGPVGMLNVAFIEDVTLSTSGFNSRYDNVLSGVLQFKQRNGNEERLQGNVRASSSEVALTAEGPLRKGNKDVTFIAGVRRSYLQFLFKLLDLPFLPNYWDYQYKVNWKAGAKNEFSFIGLGSIDEFTLNPPTKRKDGESDGAYFGKLAILDNIPVSSQSTTTHGITWKRLQKGGILNTALSLNILANGAIKYEGNDKSRPLIFNYDSRETETKLRVSETRFLGDYTLITGFNANYNVYRNSTFQRVGAADPLRGTPEFTIDYLTEIDFVRYGAFVNVSRSFFGRRLEVSAGLRVDGNTFTTGGNNLARTLAPRAAASYALTEKWSVNASLGRYYKIAPYTVLGFRDQTGTLVNRDSRFIENDHAVAGIEYRPAPNTRITVEGFYKRYNYYPVSVRDSISLANLGGDFGVLGNEDVSSTGKGRAYGVELFFQQKLTRNLYGILALTLYRSEYTGYTGGPFKPSAWDNQVLVSFTGGYKLPRNWEIGVHFRLLGSAPYTPVDSAASLRDLPLNGSFRLDFNQINSRRLPAFNALDVRIDKRFNYKRFTLNIYLEAQNAYNSANLQPPTYTLNRNAEGAPLNPPELLGLPLDASSILPTIGLIVEF